LPFQGVFSGRIGRIASNMQAQADFDPVRAARTLICEARVGALATLLHTGAPYASLVTVGTAPDAAPVMLLSRLARHTTNILADPRVSLLIDDHAAREPLENARLSLTGTIARSDDPALRRRFLSRHPSASQYADFADFAVWRLEVTGAHLVAGFGRIVELAPADVAIKVDDSPTLLAAEEGALAHMNADHRDAIERYASRLLGASAGSWRMIGIDPAGCELMSGETVRRMDFPQRVTTPDALRKMLADLSQKARSA
jgi:putative heme iron utilization protein